MKSTTAPNNVITLSPNIMSSLSKIALTEKTHQRQKKEIANCPEYPNWMSERPYLSWDFYPNPEKFESVRYKQNSYFIIRTKNNFFFN